MKQSKMTLRVCQHTNIITFILSTTILFSVILSHRLLNLSHTPLFSLLSMINQGFILVSLAILVYETLKKSHINRTKITWVFFIVSSLLTITSVMLEKMVF
ncbi:putative membrane protein YqjE [Acholeplasma morum]|uniref:hypothetical protein n=1 Tax=Paracholeplasma morum TaxID=264637 RepID=UPI00195CCDFA|nr:hypothetical protein [Paracholeplasma morum]MBM7454102.1 putative membrane protein YqjE [Paracholeplasma morum]